MWSVKRQSAFSPFSRGFAKDCSTFLDLDIGRMQREFFRLSTTIFSLTLIPRRRKASQQKIARLKSKLEIVSRYDDNFYLKWEYR